MFYIYDQNNSGGGFYVDHDRGISNYVIVEADTPEEANNTAETLGIYFNGCEAGMDCECCGDRWYAAGKGDGTDTPEVNRKEVEGVRVFEGEIKWTSGAEGYIHYKDGRVEPFWEEVPDSDIERYGMLLPEGN